MKKQIILLALLSLLLSGCGSWMNGEYYSVTPHTDQGSREEEEITAVSNYADICSALEDMVRSAVESGILSVEDYDNDRLVANMDLAVRHIKGTFPLGAYAVEDIAYEVGTTRGMSAVAVTITYNHNRNAIPKIRYVTGMDAASNLITTALNSCEASLVMHVEEYSPLDYLQLVRDYALQRPSQVMEVPQLTVNQYPESGSERVIELQFTYQNSRDVLLNMQAYVQPVFSSASLYVSGESEESTKFNLLYSFLMERNEYTVETSITPAYSLLRHGVGDSKAFASVFAALCGRAGLDCQVISGTKDAEPWFWNIICEDGAYYHMDLLNSHNADTYRKLTDDQMDGYVWDYSAYPACVAAEKTDDGTD